MTPPAGLPSSRGLELAALTAEVREGRTEARDRSDETAGRLLGITARLERVQALLEAAEERRLAEERAKHEAAQAEALATVVAKEVEKTGRWRAVAPTRTASGTMQLGPLTDDAAEKRREEKVQDRRSEVEDRRKRWQIIAGIVGSIIVAMISAASAYLAARR